MAGVVGWRLHATAAIAALAVVWGASWGRLEPVSVLSSTLTSSVHPGQFVDVRRQVAYHRRDCWSYTASTTLVDSLKYTHQVETRYYGMPDYGALSDREWQVPFTMPFGTARVQTTLSFSCLPFFGAWPITVALPELEFQIVPN